jgi:uncharacterized protein
MCQEKGLVSMDMTGERRIPAPRQLVWEALNDPEILRASIPGSQSLEKIDDTHMKATVAIKVGPISARFNGAVTLSDIDPPNGYTIMGEGQGGVAGFAKGGAKVSLTDDPGATLLKYEVNAQVGGKLAQLGARLIDATAKQMAEQFFTKFSDEVQKLMPAEVAPTPHANPSGPISGPIAPASAPLEPRPPPSGPPSAVGRLAPIPRKPFGLPIAGWIGILILGLLAVALVSMRQ